MRTLHLLSFACLAMAASAFAQTTGFPAGSTSLDAAESPAPAPSPEKNKDAAKPAGPTVITSTGDMTYDERTRTAVFTGPNYGVTVVDPQFTLNCDKLTAIMRKGAGGAASPSPAKGGKRASPAPSASPGNPKAGAAADKASGLQHALAEGDADHPIVIVQVKPPSADNAQPERDVGIAQKADYDADSGDIVLMGWPRVSQGVDTQIATSEKTVMTMNRNNNTMKTRGPSRTVIEEQSTPKPTPAAEVIPSPSL